MRSAFFFLLLLVSSSVHAKQLSEAQIEDLRTVWLDTRKNKKIVFDGGFEQRRLNPKNPRDLSKIKAYKRSGKVPFRVWAACGQWWLFKNGSKSAEYFSHLSVKFYIKNDKGKVVFNQTISLGKMADRGGFGGYFGDLPGPGTYTCVMYVKKDKMLFGKEIETTFKAYR